jgi:hypothetical protein
MPVESASVAMCHSRESHAVGNHPNENHRQPDYADATSHKLQSDTYV